MRKLLTTLTTAALVIILAGCPNDSWQKAAQLSDDFAHSIRAAQDVEIAAFNQGLIDLDDHKAVEIVFIEVAKDGQTLDAAILSGSKSKTVTQAFKAALTATEGALEANQLHIKNPNTRAEISIALTGAKSILDTMEALK